MLPLIESGMSHKYLKILICKIKKKSYNTIIQAITIFKGVAIGTPNYK